MAKPKLQDLEFEIERLKSEITHLKATKKYGLVWTPKPEQFDHHAHNALPVLEAKGGRFKDITGDAAAGDHVLIEGDNYHALSVLAYTHRGAIDVIYIDPPYNTGSTDWRYNNDYVAADDPFKHSKWLSFMDRRLRLARDLLSDQGVLICAIDDNEAATLALLLDDIFSDMVRNTVVLLTNPHGVARSGFSRTHEYAYFLLPSGMTINKKPAPEDVRNINLRRSGNNSLRTDSPTMFYPIYVDKKTLTVVRAGDVPPVTFHPAAQTIDAGKHWEVWPIDARAVEKNWYYSRKRVNDMGAQDLRCRIADTAVQLSFHHTNNGEQTYKTTWLETDYDAGAYGSTLVKDVTGQDFPFPKSLHTVRDCLSAVLKSRTATVLDFFAGSGTTGHAVLELNRRDGGHRRFILVTNNENKICEQVTFPRLKRVMTGYSTRTGDRVAGLGGNLRYLKTTFVPKHVDYGLTDEDRLEFTRRANLLLALKEHTFTPVTTTDHYEIVASPTAITGIYFRENKVELAKLLAELDRSRGARSVTVYIFSWAKGAYKTGFEDYPAFRFEDIPEPILEVYKSIGY